VKDMPVKQFPPKPVLHRSFKPPASNSGSWAGGSDSGTGSQGPAPAPWSDPYAQPWQPVPLSLPPAQLPLLLAGGLKLRCNTGLGGNCLTGISFTTGVMN
jgi:hypothetical protein